MLSAARRRDAAQLRAGDQDASALPPEQPDLLPRAIESLRVAFATIWPHAPEVVLTITESDFRWMGRSVMHEASRSESLPWVFFKDGGASSR